ncbi:3-hydroxymethyl-3-methylglutaryl-CoA lyase [Diaporthe helianthi]|uniref:hydroxymethylglutaryl-CoA lyase n=1 Tax=Diaporthe helianthi TaxID=158607 RepID=A0A2P5I7A5_DIAHE|nr:3-hydroxymethyl-3-methylglutaryl-CoA lyase [Diaporthe helianthi]
MAAVRIFEVGPRDGLQNIKSTVPTETKLGLISRLAQAGIRNIEITSAVSPKAIPQLSDNVKVLSSDLVQKALREQPHLRMSCLVPNEKGLALALKHKVKEVAVFVSATEGFSRANINCSVDEGLRRARDVTAKAKEHGLTVRGYVSCIFSDPYDGPTPMTAVLHATKSLLDAGCYEVSLGDTLGVGTALQVWHLVQYLQSQGIDVEKLAGHFHDTYGQALANVWEAYQCGIKTFDSSVGGLGGCPFAPGARGNVATEDLVYLFEHAGVHTGIDLGILARVGDWVSKELRQANQSRAGQALCLAKANSNQRATSKEQPRRLAWTPLSDNGLVSVSRSGANGKIVLCNAAKGNVLSLSMISHIDKVFSDLDSDDTISRIAIAAQGKFFCTGMDLGTFVADSSSPTRDRIFQGLSRLFKKIANSSKTTIASVNGPAFGGGVGLAFACDLRLCAKSSTFTLTEAKLGLCPAVISEHVIREWGPALARQAMLTGRPVSADELKAIGAITAVYDSAADLETATDALLDSLRYLSPSGSQMSKELVTLGWKHGGKLEQQERVAELFDQMLRPGTEGAFGAAEFHARRKVDWDAYHARDRGPLKPKL